MTIDGYHGFLIKMEIKLLLLVFNWQILICPLFRRSTTILVYFHSIFYVVKIPTIFFGQERMGLVKQRFSHHI